MVSLPNSVTKFWSLLNLMSMCLCFLSHLGNTHTRNAHCSFFNLKTQLNEEHILITYLTYILSLWWKNKNMLSTSLPDHRNHLRRRMIFYCRPPLSDGKKKIFHFIQFSKRQIWNTKLTLTYSQNRLLKLTCLEVNKTIYFCRLSISSLLGD